MIIKFLSDNFNKKGKIKNLCILYILNNYIENELIFLKLNLYNANITGWTLRCICTT